MGHCWGGIDKLISNIFSWTLIHGRPGIGQPARTYVHQLCADIGYSLEDLPKAMDDKNRWQEKVRELHASSTT